MSQLFVWGWNPKSSEQWKVPAWKFDPELDWAPLLFERSDADEDPEEDWEDKIDDEDCDEPPMPDCDGPNWVGGDWKPNCGGLWHWTGRLKWNKNIIFISND